MTSNARGHMLKARLLGLPPLTPPTPPGKSTHTHTYTLARSLLCICCHVPVTHYISKSPYLNCSSPLSFTYSRENMHYWEQFHQAHAQKMSAEQWQKQRRKNLHLAGYCVCAMLLSFAVHVIIFRQDKRLFVFGQPETPSLFNKFQAEMFLACQEVERTS